MKDTFLKIAKNMVDLGKMMGKCRFCSYSGGTVGGGNDVVSSSYNTH